MRQFRAKRRGGASAYHGSSSYRSRRMGSPVPMPIGPGRNSRFRPSAARSVCAGRRRWRPFRQEVESPSGPAELLRQCRHLPLFVRRAFGARGSISISRCWSAWRWRRQIFSISFPACTDVPSSPLRRACSRRLRSNRLRTDMLVSVPTPASSSGIF